jgi:XTP/dITP diphosphohydrolase
LGSDTEKKWSDLWYIYKPKDSDKTLAQMTDEERKERSQNKTETNDSMKIFANWYKAKNA